MSFLDLRGSRDVARWGRWRRRLRERTPDVVHLVDVMAWTLAAGAGRLPAVVAHVHGRPRDLEINSVPMPRRARLHWRALGTRIDAYACITEGARQGLVQNGLARPERTHTVYNAVDHAHLQDRPAKEDARRALGLPLTRHLVGMVCRIVDGRGCDTLLRMLPDLPGWHAAFIGDGPHRGPLEEMARGLGVADRAHFVGPLADIRPGYAALDAFVYLARYESFGLAIAEAMACDVPVFGLHSHGEYALPPRPLVTPGSATFLPRADLDQQSADDPRELLALASQLRAFEKDPEPYRSKSRVASERVRDLFSIEAQADATIEVYRTVSEAFP